MSIHVIPVALMILDLEQASAAALSSTSPEEKSRAAAKLRKKIVAWKKDPETALGLDSSAFEVPIALMNYDVSMALAAADAATGAARVELAAVVHKKIAAWRANPAEQAKTVILAALAKNNNCRKSTALELDIPLRSFFPLMTRLNVHAAADAQANAKNLPPARGMPRGYVQAGETVEA